MPHSVSTPTSPFLNFVTSVLSMMSKGVKEIEIIIFKLIIQLIPTPIREFFSEVIQLVYQGLNFIRSAIKDTIISIPKMLDKWRSSIPESIRTFVSSNARIFTWSNGGKYLSWIFNQSWLLCKWVGFRINPLNFFNNFKTTRESLFVIALLRVIYFLRRDGAFSHIVSKKLKSYPHTLEGLAARWQETHNWEIEIIISYIGHRTTQFLKEIPSFQLDLKQHLQSPKKKILIHSLDTLEFLHNLYVVSLGYKALSKMMAEFRSFVKTSLSLSQPEIGSNNSSNRIPAKKMSDRTQHQSSTRAPTDDRAPRAEVPTPSADARVAAIEASRPADEGIGLGSVPSPRMPAHVNERSESKRERP